MCAWYFFWDQLQWSKNFIVYKDIHFSQLAIDYRLFPEIYLPLLK